MKNKKLKLTILSIITFFFSVNLVSANRDKAEIIAKGNHGIDWILNDRGTLFLEEGELKNPIHSDEASIYPWTEYAPDIERVSVEGKILLPETAHLFMNFENLKQIDNIDLLDTSNVKDMSFMFYQVKKIEHLDLSSWDVSSVTNMNYMFNGASRLNSIDLSSWDISSVTTTKNIFNNTNDLNLSNLVVIEDSNSDNEEKNQLLQINDIDLEKTEKQSQQLNGWKKIDDQWYFYEENDKVTGWKKVNHNWYYMNETGIMQTGWQKINSNWYYLRPSGSMVTGSYRINGKSNVFTIGGRWLGNWEKNTTGWWFKDTNKNYPISEWKKLNNHWYYFDNKGYMVTGWKKVKNNWYYLNSSGAMQTGWNTINNKRYYLDSSGVMETGWLKISNNWYYFSSNGSMRTGWLKSNDKWYYLESEGVMQTSWTKVNNHWYYLSDSGVMETGWRKSGKNWYYLNTGGSMATGWKKVKGVWYYLNDNGSMQTGWIKLNNKWYYLNSGGAMQTGWRKSGKNWYYLNTGGSMATGWKKIKGVWYYLNDNGSMQIGWIKLNNKWYYLDSSGSMQTGWVIVNNEKYYLNSSGVWIPEKKSIRIFIDAGHGGTDSGAKGNDLLEKDLTLKISEEINKYLRRYEDIEVMMSRTNDKTLSLKERTQMANNWIADFFLSVHINSFTQSSAHGFESFIYNNNATNEEKEKQQIIHDNIARNMVFSNDRGKKQANFHVLRETNMPAMLIEYLFISNKDDSDNLKDAKYIDRLAKYTAEGIAKAHDLTN